MIIQDHAVKTQPSPATWRLWLNSRQSIVFWAISLVYFLLTFLLASHRRFWNDELFTYYIARRPSFAEVWKVLLTGAEQLPPLFYLITRAFGATFGFSKLAFRLPEIIAFWVMSVSLYWFVRKRLSTEYALLAMTFPMLTDAFHYAVEARPYALVLGFSGLALVCWQSSVEHPILSRVGLLLCLAAAVSCHYYAVFVFAPLVAGETYRSWTLRRLDMWTWSAILGGFAPLVFYLPLIRAAAKYSSTFWAKPSWGSSFAFFQDLLIPTTLTFLTVIVIAAVCLFTARSDEFGNTPPRRQLSYDEVIAMAAFTVIPIAAVTLAKLLTGAFASRYALPAVIGLTILFAYSIWIVGRQSSNLAMIVTAAMIVFLLINSSRDYRQYTSELSGQANLYDFLEQHQVSNVPMVIAGPQMFLETSHLDEERRDNGNLTYLDDPRLAVEYTGTDDVDLGLLALRKIAPIRVEDFHEFCASHKRFKLYGETEVFAWTARELIREGWQFKVAAARGSHFLFDVTAPNAETP